MWTSKIGARDKFGGKMTRKQYSVAQNSQGKFMDQMALTEDYKR